MFAKLINMYTPMLDFLDVLINLGETDLQGCLKTIGSTVIRGLNQRVPVVLKMKEIRINKNFKPSYLAILLSGKQIKPARNNVAPAE